MSRKRYVIANDAFGPMYWNEKDQTLYRGSRIVSVFRDRRTAKRAIIKAQTFWRKIDGKPPRGGDHYCIYLLRAPEGR